MYVQGDTETSRDEEVRDDRLGAAERRYYSEMCDVLFQKYTTIKAHNVEVGGRIWNYFVPGKVLAMCRLCKTSVKRGPAGNLTNLSAHLQKCHGKVFTDMVETEAIKQVMMLLVLCLVVCHH